MMNDRSPQDYGEFLKQLSTRDLSGEKLSPQLVLSLKQASMAQALTRGIPQNAKSLLNAEAHVVEFGDGGAAVCFPLKTGNDIIGLLRMLGQGDYDEPPRITNGMAIRLPMKDRQTLRSMVNSQNLFGVGRLLDEEDFWRW